MHIRCSTLLLSLAVLAGCGRENTQVITERRAAVSAKLDQIQKLAKALGPIAPVSEGKLTMGAAPLVLTTVTDTELPTGTVVYEQSLANPRTTSDAPPHYTDRIQRAKLLEDCGALLERGGISPNFDPVNMPASIAKQLLDSCANLEYVFVLRTRKLAGREFEGDVVAFALSSEKYLGGFPISFTSEGRTDTVTSTTRTPSTRRVGNRTRTTVTTETVTRSVDADREQLRSDLAEEVESNIRRLVPGVRGLR